MYGRGPDYVQSLARFLASGVKPVRSGVRFTIRLLLCVGLLALHAPSTNADPAPVSCVWARVTCIVDGDTIDVDVDGSTFRVRYIGMNTTEVGQPCYNEGTAENRLLVDGEMVCLDKDVSETDRYGRLLRYVYVGDTMVNAELVRRGVASAATYPPDVRYAGWFVQLEQEARQAGRGCWAIATAYTVWLPIMMKPASRPAPTPTCTRTPEPTRLRTPTPTQTRSPAAIRVAAWCSQFNAPGNDHQNLNEEYVCFDNQGSAAADMTGWHVKDANVHTYTFPTFSLASGAWVKLRTGCGSNTATDLYWCRSQAVWNNDGDTVYLYNAAWALVDQYRY